MDRKESKMPVDVAATCLAFYDYARTKTPAAKRPRSGPSRSTEEVFSGPAEGDADVEIADDEDDADEQEDDATDDDAEDGD
jgi:hypothetical protein